MNILIFLSIAIPIFGFAFAPFWFPQFYAQTLGYWRLPKTDRLFVDMVSDLLEEDCWKPLTGTVAEEWRHLHSGIEVRQRFSWTASVGGSVPYRSFSGWHPLRFKIARFRQRMKRASERQASVQSLESINRAFREMKKHEDTPTPEKPDA